MPPVPIGFSSPAEVIEMPLAVPCAVTCKGSAVEVPTVLMLTKAPVFVLPVVSRKLNAAAVEVPVSAPDVQVQLGLDGAAFAAHVSEVVSPAGIVKDNAAVGATKEDHGSPVALVRTNADGVPRFGVTKVGEVARTMLPVPEGVAASAVATPVPRPLIPVATGNPVALVNTSVVGVPSPDPLGTVTVPVKVGEASGAAPSVL